MCPLVFIWYLSELYTPVHMCRIKNEIWDLQAWNIVHMLHGLLFIIVYFIRSLVFIVKLTNLLDNFSFICKCSHIFTDNMTFCKSVDVLISKLKEKCNFFFFQFLIVCIFYAYKCPFCQNLLGSQMVCEWMLHANSNV